jgi:hypothetical protein
MFLNFAVVAIGILVSFFLKGINFLSLDLESVGGGILYPDFLLILVIFFALRRGDFSALWVGFFSMLFVTIGHLRCRGSWPGIGACYQHASTPIQSGISLFLRSFHIRPAISRDERARIVRVVVSH